MRIDNLQPLSLTPTAGANPQRLESIDILRGLALFGVLSVNLVTEFRVSIFEQFLTEPGESSLINRAVIQFVHHGLELKAFALFSLLFGVGMAMQFERLSHTGRPLYWLTRRLVVLFSFGLIHLLLIWNGDILTEYAVAGLLVLPLLLASRKVLGFIAAALFILYLSLPSLPIPVSWPDQDWIIHHVAQANETYRAGTWFQVMQFSLRELPDLLPLHVYIFPRTLGLFVLGILAWRSGIFSRPEKYKGKIVSLVCVVGATGAAITFAKEPAVISTMAPVCLALAFTGAVLYAVEFTPARTFLHSFAALGRMAFTNYIVQSLIFGLIFFGYGLGQFGSLRPAPVFALGIAVYFAQLQLSKFWLSNYRFGPIEWCWRTLMYGQLQPMRR
jgi:uncharacterized protein